MKSKSAISSKIEHKVNLGSHLDLLIDLGGADCCLPASHPTMPHKLLHNWETPITM